MSAPKERKLVWEENGKLKFAKLEPIAAIHLNQPHQICPQCKKQWRFCACEMTPQLYARIQIVK